MHTIHVVPKLLIPSSEPLILITIANGQPWSTDFQTCRNVLPHETLSSAEAFLQYRRKPREKKKAEPLPQNMRFSAQKSRFLACATTTTVQTQENLCSDTHVIVGFIKEPRGRAELGVAQDSDKSLTGLEL